MEKDFWARARNIPDTWPVDEQGNREAAARRAFSAAGLDENILSVAPRDQLSRAYVPSGRAACRK